MSLKSCIVSLKFLLILLLSWSYGNVTYRYVIVNSLIEVHYTPCKRVASTVAYLAWYFDNLFAFMGCLSCLVSFAAIIWDFKQITTAGTDMAAKSNLPPKIMRQCACMLVAYSSKHEIWLHELRCFAVEATTSSLFSGPFQQTFWHFENSIGYYVL